MISVILPTYENPESVLCALEALRNQDYSDFEVVIVDDSNDDSVRDAVWPPYEGVWYIRSSPPRVGRFTASRARNIGVANSRGDLLVFIDQDVMLHPTALGRYQDAYYKHGDNVVYVGLYHWLMRMDFGPVDVANDFRGIMESGLNLVPEPYYEYLEMDEPGLLGFDMRTDDFGDIDKIVDDAALGCFSGNIGYPRPLYMKLGGFDEMIRGHGGEDADLGLTAKEAGAKFLLWDGIWGLHRWHSRDQKANVADVQKNIDYIDRKHGIGQYADAHKWTDARDWSDPQHYHKDVGGVLMKTQSDPTTWVCRDGHRMGLPTIQALNSLGFYPEQTLIVPVSSLERYEVHAWPN